MKSINKYKNSKGKIFLNVASSTYVIEGFVNLDNHIFLLIFNLYNFLKKIIPKKYHGLFNRFAEAKKKAKLIRHDCRKPLFFPNNSVDHILCSHFLEHVFPQEAEQIIADFYRVLKPGGTVHVIVPNIENQINYYLQRKKEGKPEAADILIKETLLSKENRGTFKYRLMELNGGFGLQHRWMYDDNSMRLRLEKAGFKINSKNSTPSASFRENDDSVHLVGMK